MNSNVGGIDRTIRILLGIALVALAATRVVTGGLATGAFVVGGIALVTGLVRYCPAYSPFGINTCSPKSTPNQ